jgi:membrane-associated protease RseP (regulator of RpoE activity)
MSSTVVGLPDTFVFDPIGTKTAGTPFSVTLTATLSAGGTDTSYSGTKTIVWSGAANSPGGNAPVYQASVTFASGVGTATLTLFKAASTTLTATEAAVTGASAPFTVQAGTILLTFSNCPPSSVKKGKTSSLTVSRADAYGNADPNQATARTVNLTTTAGSWSPTSVTIAANSATSGASTLTNSGSSGVSVTITAHSTSGTYTDATCSYTTTN